MFLVLCLIVLSTEIVDRILEFESERSMGCSN